MGQKLPNMDAFRDAVEHRDAKALKNFYSANAVMTIIDSTHPPSKPQTLKGVEEIGAFFEDVCSRDMSHKFEEGMIDAHHLAFVENCRYADGTRVVASNIAELGPNGIVRQTMVQAWDN